MQKLKTRSFPAKIQQVMDTRNKYYNPFEYLNSDKTYGGFDEYDKFTCGMEDLKTLE